MGPLLDNRARATGFCKKFPEEIGDTSGIA
jgi:hypothetical protein